jgi:Tol biopolymer transport system component
MKLGKLLISLVVVSLLVSMALPMVSAPKPPPDDPPADPAIAYYESGRKADKLMVMNEDGSNQATIYEEDFSVWGGLSWSPDGGSITWAGYHGSMNNDGVWRIDVSVVDGEPQGSNLQQIVNSEDVHLVTSAAWSPLGDEIIFATGDQTSNHWWINSVPPTGGPITTVYAGNELGINPRSLTWSSDGTRIAFIEDTLWTEECYIKIIERATGSTTHTLVFGQYEIRTVDWARQEVDELVFTDELTETIYILDIDTETVESVATGYQPCWSSDNLYVAYRSTGRKTNIYKIELSSGATTKLASGFSPSWRW